MTTADTVNTWFAQRLGCGALARDTQAYNQVRAALPDLVARLDARIAPAPAAPPAIAPAPAAPPAIAPAAPSAAETQTDL